MSRDKQLWECPKCHEHFYQYVIDDRIPVCAHHNKACPAKIAADANRGRGRLVRPHGSGPAHF